MLKKGSSVHIQRQMQEREWICCFKKKQNEERKNRKKKYRRQKE